MNERDPDLSPLFPARSRERLVGRILEAATPELLRRQAALRSPWLMLAEWARPALAAAALIALASAVVLGLGRGRAAVQLAVDTGSAPASGVTEALDVPSPLDAWIAGDRDPSVSDLVVAVEEGGIR